MTSLSAWLEESALRVGHLLVPAAQRADWLRSWTAELCYAHQKGRTRHAAGLIRDALWLRRESWWRPLVGSAPLCMTWLLGLAFLATLPLLVFIHAGYVSSHLLLRLLPRYAVAAALTVFVGFATASASITDTGFGRSRSWMRASVFHALKVPLLLVPAALVSTDLCLPLEVRTSFAAMPLELLAFVFITLLGLRWNVADSQTRCKHCLRSLAPPQRVGRPTWNLLDYNGMELACYAGHGRLAVPELETSWCRSSSWISQAS